MKERKQRETARSNAGDHDTCKPFNVGKLGAWMDGPPRVDSRDIPNVLKKKGQCKPWDNAVLRKRGKGLYRKVQQDKNKLKSAKKLQGWITIRAMRKAVGLDFKDKPKAKSHILYRYIRK